MSNETQIQINELGKAMFGISTPCNPLPFLEGLKMGVKEMGTDWIRSDDAKRILFTILQQVYGSAFKIDSFEEFKNLSGNIESLTGSIEETNTSDMGALKVEKILTEEDIISLLCTALEGGSNYWYYLPYVDEVRALYPEKEPLVDKIGKAVMRHNLTVLVSDIENQNEILGSISRDSLTKGSRLYIESGRDLNPEIMDACDADVWFQYVVMGQIVFG